MCGTGLRTVLRYFQSNTTAAASVSSRVKMAAGVAAGILRNGPGLASRFLGSPVLGAARWVKRMTHYVLLGKSTTSPPPRQLVPPFQTTYIPLVWRNLAKKKKNWSALVCQPPKVQKWNTKKYRNILSYSGPCCPIWACKYIFW